MRKYNKLIIVFLLAAVLVTTMSTHTMAFSWRELFNRFNYRNVVVQRNNTPAEQTAPEPVERECITAQPEPQEQPLSNQNLAAEEQEMLRLINQERTSRGISPLEMDPRVVDVARRKSQDMIDNNYFSHNSPTYGSPFDMLRDAGISYRTAGENIAGNRSVEAAHRSLMNSSGHRRNILNPNYNKVGIGIREGGPYGMMFTQMFIGE